MNSLLGRWTCHSSCTYYISYKCQVQFYFPLKSFCFSCSYRRSAPLSIEQSFHMGMNLCSTISSSLNWLYFLSLLFFFWLLCSPLPSISSKTCHHDQKRKINCTCFFEIIRKQKILVTVKVFEYYIIKKLIFPAERKIYDCFYKYFLWKKHPQNLKTPSGNTQGNFN